MVMQLGFVNHLEMIRAFIIKFNRLNQFRIENNPGFRKSNQNKNKTKTNNENEKTE